MKSDAKVGKVVLIYAHSIISAPNLLCIYYMIVRLSRQCGTSSWRNVDGADFTALVLVSDLNQI